MIGGILKGVARTMDRGGRKPQPMDEKPRPNADDHTVGEETSKRGVLKRLGGRLKRDFQNAPAGQLVKGARRLLGRRKGAVRGGSR